MSAKYSNLAYSFSASSAHWQRLGGVSAAFAVSDFMERYGIKYFGFSPQIPGTGITELDALLTHTSPTVVVSNNKGRVKLTWDPDGLHMEILEGCEHLGNAVDRMLETIYASIVPQTRATDNHPTARFYPGATVEDFRKGLGI